MGFKPSSRKSWCSYREAPSERRGGTSWWGYCTDSGHPPSPHPRRAPLLAALPIGVLDRVLIKENTNTSKNNFENYALNSILSMNYSLGSWDTGRSQGVESPSAASPLQSSAASPLLANVSPPPLLVIWSPYPRPTFDITWLSNPLSSQPKFPVFAKDFYFQFS